MDFYLKFTSEEEAKAVLYTVTPAVLDEETNVLSEETVKPNYMNIDVLGTIYNDDTVIGEDGEVVTPATAKDGYHVNVRVVAGENGNVLQSYAVTPTAPRRVWA